MNPACQSTSRRLRVQGFTLIELMVVLVIIGVLAALIVPNVLDRADDARVTAARTDVNNLMQALKLYDWTTSVIPQPTKGSSRWCVNPPREPFRPTGALISTSCPTIHGVGRTSTSTRA